MPESWCVGSTCAAEDGGTPWVCDRECVGREPGGAPGIAECADADEVVREARDNVPLSGTWRYGLKVNGSCARGDQGLASCCADGGAWGVGLDVGKGRVREEVVATGSCVCNG